MRTTTPDTLPLLDLRRKPRTPRRTKGVPGRWGLNKIAFQVRRDERRPLDARWQRIASQSASDEDVASYLAHVHLDAQDILAGFTVDADHEAHVLEAITRELVAIDTIYLESEVA